jgi:hypothetical protein
VQDGDIGQFTEAALVQKASGGAKRIKEIEDVEWSFAR